MIELSVQIKKNNIMFISIYFYNIFKSAKCKCVKFKGPKTLKQIYESSPVLDEGGKKPEDQEKTYGSKLGLETKRK